MIDSNLLMLMSRKIKTLGVQKYIQNVFFYVLYGVRFIFNNKYQKYFYPCQLMIFQSIIFLQIS